MIIIIRKRNSSVLFRRKSVSSRESEASKIKLIRFTGMTFIFKCCWRELKTPREGRRRRRRYRNKSLDFSTEWRNRPNNNDSFFSQVQFNRHHTQNGGIAPYIRTNFRDSATMADLFVRTPLHVQCSTDAVAQRALEAPWGKKRNLCLFYPPKVLTNNKQPSFVSFVFCTCLCQLGLHMRVNLCYDLLVRPI